MTSVGRNGDTTDVGLDALGQRAETVAWVREIADMIERGELTTQVAVITQTPGGNIETTNGFHCLPTLIGALDHFSRSVRTLDDKEIRDDVLGEPVDPIKNAERLMDQWRDTVVELVRKTGGPDLRKGDQ